MHLSGGKKKKKKKRTKIQMMKNGVAGVAKYINSKKKGRNSANDVPEEVAPQVLMEPHLAQTSILRVIILVSQTQF